jgi:hypothetical protein
MGFARHPSPQAHSCWFNAILHNKTTLLSTHLAIVAKMQELKTHTDKPKVLFQCILFAQATERHDHLA